jgi:hypothetical protein
LAPTIGLFTNINQNIIAFCLSALLTIGASIIKCVLEQSSRGDKIIQPRKSTERNDDHWYYVEERNSEVSISPKWTKVLNKLILGLSDQQLASSLALLITAFARHCTISNYHLNIAQDLAWFSCITHLCSVIALRGYWKAESRQPAICTRLVLMFSMLVLLMAAMFWGPEYDPSLGVASCPAQCTFEYATVAEMFSEANLTTTVLSAAGNGQGVFLLLCYSMCLMFVAEWYRWFSMKVLLDGPEIVCFHLLRMFKRIPLPGLPPRLEPLRVPGSLAVYYLRSVYLHFFFPSQEVALGFQIISWCWGLAWLLVDRQIPKTSVQDEEVENQWGFGQLFGVLLLGVPAMALLEAWAGKMSL